MKSYVRNSIYIVKNENVIFDSQCIKSKIKFNSRWLRANLFMCEVILYLKNPRMDETDVINLIQKGSNLNMKFNSYVYSIKSY